MGSCVLDGPSGQRIREAVEVLQPRNRMRGRCIGLGLWLWLGLGYLVFSVTYLQSKQPNPNPNPIQRPRILFCGWSTSTASQIRCPLGPSSTHDPPPPPNEQLKVSGGNLFCTACREELGLKRSTIQNHVQSQKRKTSKKKLEMKEKREQDIADALAKHNSEVHLRGETLPVSQQVYRVKVEGSLTSTVIGCSRESFFSIEKHFWRAARQLVAGLH